MFFFLNILFFNHIISDTYRITISQSKDSVIYFIHKCNHLLFEAQVQSSNGIISALNVNLLLQAIFSQWETHLYSSSAKCDISVYLQKKSFKFNFHDVEFVFNFQVTNILSIRGLGSKLYIHLCFDFWVKEFQP